MVDSELLEIFRGYHARRRSEFVIESSGEPDAAALYDHYRCDADIQALITWLRSHGVRSKTPLHTLRKEYGSQINAHYGLTAAQEMLRHSDISITSAHYVENKQRSVLGFGHLLKGDRTIVPMREAGSRENAKNRFRGQPTHFRSSERRLLDNHFCLEGLYLFHVSLFL